MAACYAFKTAVKLTFNKMSNSDQKCRCCYSNKNLTTLSDTASGALTTICHPQGLKSGNDPILVCPVCLKFLEEVHQFKMEGHAYIETFHDNSAFKDICIESIRTNASSVDIDTDIVEMETNPSPNKKRIRNNCPNTETNEFYVTSAKRPKESQHSRETIFSCDHCAFKCNMKTLMIIHQIDHAKKRQKPRKSHYVRKSKKNYTAYQLLEKIADKVCHKPTMEPPLLHQPFGDYVAEKLQNLRPDMVKLCKRMIDDAIFNGMNGLLNRNSVLRIN